MTAMVCKKCKSFILGKNWCIHKGIFRTPYDTMCDEGKTQRQIQVDEWLEGHGKGKI